MPQNIFNVGMIQSKYSFQEEQKKAADTTLEEATSSSADAPKVRLVTKKLLKGHLNKVTSVHYSGDNRYGTKNFSEI